MGIRLFLCLIVLSLACSGSSQSAHEGPESPANSQPAPTDAEREEAARQEALQKLDARQEAACERLSVAMYPCAIESAKDAGVSADEIAQLQTDQMRQAYQAKFLGECTTGKMSLRQVKVFETCLDGDTTCSVLVPCLDKAAPQE